MWLRVAGLQWQDEGRRGVPNGRAAFRGPAAAPAASQQFQSPRACPSLVS